MKGYGVQAVLSGDSTSPDWEKDLLENQVHPFRPIDYPSLNSQPKYLGLE